jgi:hypothetical protein
MRQAGKENYWSPYIAGAFAGLVLVLSVWFTGKYFGASTSFVRSAGLIEKIFSAERVSEMDYFVKTAPKIEWQWMFVVGILIGSLAASRLSGTYKLQAVPDMWQDTLRLRYYRQSDRCIYRRHGGHVWCTLGRRLTVRTWAERSGSAGDQRVHCAVLLFYRRDGECQSLIPGR